MQLQAANYCCNKTKKNKKIEQKRTEIEKCCYFKIHVAAAATVADFYFYYLAAVAVFDPFLLITLFMRINPMHFCRRN